MVAEWLRGLVFEEEDVVNFLARSFIKADRIHLFTIRSSVGDPDFVVHHDGSGPGPASDWGLPNDILTFAPLDGESMNLAVCSWWIVAIVGRAAESGPFSLAGTNETGKKKGSNEHNC